jgi:hypothetical protein
MHTPPPDPATISFGLSLEEDRHSCATYLRLLGRADFAELLSSRLTSDEIEALVDLTAQLMRTHLSKQEYHLEFLAGG